MFYWESQNSQMLQQWTSEPSMTSVLSICNSLFSKKYRNDLMEIQESIFGNSNLEPFHKFQSNGGFSNISISEQNPEDITGLIQQGLKQIKTQGIYSQDDESTEQSPFLQSSLQQDRNTISIDNWQSNTNPTQNSSSQASAIQVSESQKTYSLSSSESTTSKPIGKNVLACIKNSCKKCFNQYGVDTIKDPVLKKIFWRLDENGKQTNKPSTNENQIKELFSHRPLRNIWKAMKADNLHKMMISSSKAELDVKLKSFERMEQLLCMTLRPLDDSNSQKYT